MSVAGASGWSTSMAGMWMPGRPWLDAAASFVGMWVAMMAAMMLPSLAPVLWRYRRGIASAGARHPGWLTAVVGAAYFGVWGVLGAAIFPLGVALSAVEMRFPALARAAPIVAGVVVVIAGALQFTAWKAHHLACWRDAPGRGRTLSATAGAAWRYGLRLGVQCGYCSAGPTAALLVLGLMNLRVMALVAGAITAERLAPGAERIARAIGIVGVGAGVLLIVRAAGAG